MASMQCLFCGQSLDRPEGPSTRALHCPGCGATFTPGPAPLSGQVEKLQSERRIAPRLVEEPVPYVEPVREVSPERRRRPETYPPRRRRRRSTIFLNPTTIGAVGGALLVGGITFLTFAAQSGGSRGPEPGLILLATAVSAIVGGAIGLVLGFGLDALIWMIRSAAGGRDSGKDLDDRPPRRPPDWDR